MEEAGRKSRQQEGEENGWWKQLSSKAARVELTDLYITNMLRGADS